MEGKVSLEPGIADILIRSRQTLLEILEDRGYDTTMYRNIAPDQLVTLATGHPRALDILAKKRPDSTAPCERAVVVYSLQQSIRLRLATFTRDIFTELAGSSNEIHREDDIIVIINEPYNEAFDKVSLQMWQQQRVRMVFFHIKQVVVNLTRHVLVPPHRKMTPEEAKAIMEKLHITQKSQLPLIKHHDIQARLLGLVPGDLVEIRRPSPTAGEALVYRMCSA
jgi:DNA-directed RNA polymerase subunit H (RpoH/RPB5)